MTNGIGIIKILKHPWVDGIFTIIEKPHLKSNTQTKTIVGSLVTKIQRNKMTNQKMTNMFILWVTNPHITKPFC